MILGSKEGKGKFEGGEPTPETMLGWSLDNELLVEDPVDTGLG